MKESVKESHSSTGKKENSCLEHEEFKQLEDSRIKKLVLSILFLKHIFEDIIPFTSSQCNEEEFTVEFGIAPTDGGLCALGIITHAARRVSQKNITVVARSHNEEDPFDPRNLTFHLIGKNKADPDNLAVVIEHVFIEFMNHEADMKGII